MKLDIKAFEEAIRSNCINGVYSGSINISCESLTKLPDLSDITVEGNFICSYNNLRSLKGSPKIVTGYCSFSYTAVKSLKYAPEIIGDDLCCDGNNLISLKGLPKDFKGGIWFSRKTWDKLPKDTNEAMHLLLNCKIRFCD